MKRRSRTARLRVSRRQALMDMALVVDMISQIIDDAHTPDEKRRAIDAARVIIQELHQALVGNRPPLQMTSMIGGISTMLEKDLCENVWH
jgi:hypothetical protein